MGAGPRGVVGFCRSSIVRTAGMPYYAIHRSGAVPEPIGIRAASPKIGLDALDPRAEALQFLCGRHGGHLIGLWITPAADQCLILAALPDDETARLIGAAICSVGMDWSDSGPHQRSAPV